LKTLAEYPPSRRLPAPTRSPVLPLGARSALSKRGVRPTRFLLTVSIAAQTLTLWERVPAATSKLRARRPARPRSNPPAYQFRERYVASTSRFGIGQIKDSNKTPLGLHRIARKIGGGQPVGTAFKARVPIGMMWEHPEATIVHRILWLAGMEPGFNRGGNVDTFRRYVYIHGFNDETTLGRPASCGCVHLAARDLLPLYDQLPTGTLVWIGRR
jgi:hypothetical protein